MTSTKPGIIRRLFGAMWALITWIRTALANIIFIVIALIIFFAFSSQHVAQMPADTALRLNISGLLVDQYSYTAPLTQIMAQSSPEQAETRVRDVVEVLKRARDDKRINSVVLELQHLRGGGLSKLQEIGTAIEAFKSSGKPVLAISDNYTQDQYYLASHADEIHLNPMGAVLVTGYSSYRYYYKDILDKLSLNYHVFRAGTYKDAVEPYLQNEMSEASREHNSLWLNDLWQTYTEQVEVARNLKAGTLNDYINNIDQHLAQAGGDTASLALRLGLVDDINSNTNLRNRMIKRYGEKEGQYRALNHLDYLAFTNAEQPKYEHNIGLLTASGMILDGEQPEGTIGSSTLSTLIRDARADKSIKALVLRIDSGGGSAFASEVIRQELQATRDQGIPVIVSMGSVAASGGYWIAMASDEVWATPTTITGSIGVFSAFPTFEKSLTKLGIHTDGLGTTDLAGSLRLDRELSPLAANVLQQGVTHVYRKFLNIVAEARKTTPERVDTMAQGRVWTGKAAQQLGLVDQLGSLDDAIAASAQYANLNNYGVKEIRKALTPQEQFAQELARGLNGGVSLASADSVWLIQLKTLFKPLLDSTDFSKAELDPKRIQILCLECAAH